MTLTLLLAIGITMLAALVLYCIVVNVNLYKRIDDWKENFNGALGEARMWEARAHDYSLRATEAENMLAQMNTKLAPESHDVHQTDVENLILSSPDPIWKFIAENRDLLKMWEQKRLDIVNTQPHYRYSEFATWLANFCEGHFNREDVQRAIEGLEVVR